MTNRIKRRDFLKIGLTALAGTALSSLYPARTEAQGNLATQVADIERYVTSHPSETGVTRVIPPGKHRYVEVGYSQYNGRNFKVRTHNFGLEIREFLRDREIFFYNSKDNGLRSVDVITEVPGRIRDDTIELLSVEALRFASPRALTSLAQSVSQRRDDIRGGQRSILDEMIMRRRNPDGTLSIYDFKNQTATRLNNDESAQALREMRSAYREVVERIHRQLITR